MCFSDVCWSSRTHSAVCWKALFISVSILLVIGLHDFKTRAVWSMNQWGFHPQHLLQKSDVGKEWTKKSFRRSGQVLSKLKASEHHPHIKLPTAGSLHATIWLKSLSQTDGFLSSFLILLLLLFVSHSLLVMATLLARESSAVSMKSYPLVLRAGELRHFKICFIHIQFKHVYWMHMILRDLFINIDDCLPRLFVMLKH